jgi:recombination protein RecR
LGVIQRLQEELTRLPGIGPKSAERLTHYLLGADCEQVMNLAEAIRQIKERVHQCRQCHNLTENELCSICSDAQRDPSIICVVEQPRDVAYLERTGVFRGTYHVLHGRLAPLDNVGPAQLTIDSLLRRVNEGNIKEIIMATNPTLEGDGTALYLLSMLEPTGVKITRLARGLPSGSSIEFANNAMLADALEGRRLF